MSPAKRRGGPRQEAAPQIATAASLTPVDSLDDLAHHIDGAFVLVVHVTGGQYRRRCFLTAKSAERAARNATAAGYKAKVYLAELKPLWVLQGGESHD